MNEVLKQRLVGALILVALGVIFWPIIFVQPEQEVFELQQGIPPQPQISDASLEPPGQGTLRASPPIEVQREIARAEPEPAPAPKPEPEPKSSSTPPAQVSAPQPPKEKLQLDADGVPKAWILQVASVSTLEKAETLRKRLLEMNYKAYVENVNSNGRRLYRVYVGPKMKQSELEAMRAAIDAEFGVTSMIRRYAP